VILAFLIGFFFISNHLSVTGTSSDQEFFSVFFYIFFSFDCSSRIPDENLNFFVEMGRNVWWLEGRATTARKKFKIIFFSRK
jgi:hypothetical protein